MPPRARGLSKVLRNLLKVVRWRGIKVEFMLPL